MSSFHQLCQVYFRRFSHYNANYAIPEAPHSTLKLSLVMPAYGEDLDRAMDNLQQCRLALPEMAELLLVINQAEGEEKYRALHRAQVEKWQGKTLANGLKVQCLDACDLPPRQAGVGLARKIGMDRALERFQQIGTDGLIACVDADCHWSENYLEHLIQCAAKASIRGLSLYFEHPYRHLPRAQKAAVIDYENWLRYYSLALRYCQYPHHHHTVGSSMAVRASAYAQIGGMNRRRAGEDFYFLHKLMPGGHFYSSAGCTVYPQARESERVPFGTGRAMLEIRKKQKDFSKVYHPAIFEELREVQPQLEQLPVGKSLPSSFRNFLSAQPRLEKSWQSLCHRSKNPQSSRENFWQWWNGFGLLQYVHFRQSSLPDLPLEVALRQMDEQPPAGAEELLHFLREKDRRAAAL